MVRVSGTARGKVVKVSLVRVRDDKQSPSATERIVIASALANFFGHVLNH